MKKLIFGCTLLIMGTIMMGTLRTLFASSFFIAIFFGVIGLVFVLMGFADD